MAARPRPRATDSTTPRARPRPRKASSEEAAPEPPPRSADVIPFDHPSRRLTRALEEITVAAKELALPPLRLDWDETDEERSSETEEQRTRKAEVESFLSDYEGARRGPITWALPDIVAPENPDEFLVENLIRPGTTIMLSGPPGAAKSWASRQLALSCGAGLGTFLDRYAIHRRMNVLVVDEDNGPDEEYRREERLLGHLSITRADVATVRRVSLEGVLLDQQSWQRWLRGQIRMHELDLVILDPISELHGGKELREDPEFRSLLAFLKRLKVDFPRLATVLVHHTRKLSASDRTASRGLEDVRGQWGQTPDVVVLLSPLGERRSKWEVHKRVPHSSLLLEQGEDGALSLIGDETTGQTRRQTTDGRVLGAIRAGARTAEEIRIGTGLSKAGVFKAIARLSSAGLIPARAPYEVIRDALEEGDE